MKPICLGDQSGCTCYGNFEGLPLWARAFFGLVSYNDPCLIRWYVPGELDKFAAVWWSISLIKSTSRRPCWLAFVSRGFSWGYPTLLGKMWTGIQRPPKFCGTNHWFWGKPPGVSSKSLENQASLQEKTAEWLIYFTLRFCDINGLDRKSEQEMIDVDGFPCLAPSKKRYVSPKGKLLSGCPDLHFSHNIPSEALDPFPFTNCIFFGNHSRTEQPQTQMGVSKNRENPQNGWWK